MGLWDIDKIPYVGREKGPQEGLAFHYYDADKVVAGKKMKDWLRFGVAWWHTFDQELVDPFGTGTAQRPWSGKYSDPEDEALAKVDYAFEFFQKLGVEYFCFHDRDIAPEGDTLRETDKNLDKVVDKIEENMKSTGIKLLWNTSSLFTIPRFVSGASTSPLADLYAYARGLLHLPPPTAAGWRRPRAFRGRAWSARRGSTQEDLACRSSSNRRMPAD